MSKKPKKSPRDIVWKSKSLVVPDCQSKFLGNDQLPQHISYLETPYEFFTELFTESLIDHIVKCQKETRGTGPKIQQNVLADVKELLTVPS
jgi:hypothetical protein